MMNGLTQDSRNLFISEFLFLDLHKNNAFTVIKSLLRLNNQ